MSFENRKREFDRLAAAGRVSEIPQSLIDEFGKVEKVAKVTPKKKLGVALAKAETQVSS